METNSIQTKISDTVSFIDKTGERLTGRIIDKDVYGKETLVVRCHKRSWNMIVNCIVTEASVKLVDNDSTDKSPTKNI